MANTQVPLPGLAVACPICAATTFLASTDQPAPDDVISCGRCRSRYTYGFLLRRMPEEPPLREVSAVVERPRSEPVLLTQYLIQEIARAAYFRAQNRGFAPGHEKQDWLEAELNVLQTGSMLKHDR